MKNWISIFSVLLVSAGLPALHAAEAFAFANAKPRRYIFATRASELDPRARPHPEIDFVFEKDGKPADVQHAPWPRAWRRRADW